MPALFFKTRFIIALLLSALLLATSCKKTQETYVANILEQYFEQNILNRNFIVRYASDEGTEITTQYDGWVFKLFKNTYYDGPMTAIKNGVTYNGTWSSNEDFGKLIITVNQPSIPAEFSFINRQWRFTEKALPVMKLAPWGSTAAKVLHMERIN